MTGSSALTTLFALGHLNGSPVLECQNEEKVGFNAMHNVQWQEEKSMVYTSFAKPDPKVSERSEPPEVRSAERLAERLAERDLESQRRKLRPRRSRGHGS